MKLKLLNKTELTDLYRSDLVRDFPKSELKPLKGMLSLMDRGKYEPLAVLEGERLIGYAMVWLPPERKGALLEYFGVRPRYRNGGVGGRVLDLLTERYGQLFGEAEAPCDEDPAVNGLRRRRLAFY